MKLEGCTSSSTSNLNLPIDAVIPIIHSESASSTESDVSNGGIEADTEESMTSEEEPDKPACATPCDVKEPGKDKWIAVKGHPVLSSSSPSSSSSET